MMFQQRSTDSPAPTELALTRRDRTWVLSIGAAVGVAFGIGVPWLAGLANRTEVIPFHDLLVWLGSFDRPWLTWLRPVVGLVLGLAVALVIIRTTPVVTVSDDELRIRRRGGDRRIARGDVAGVYRDGSEVIVESAAGRRLLASRIEGGRDRIAEAFRRHGYPWEGG